jgi:hypothetical protein
MDSSHQYSHEWLSSHRAEIERLAVAAEMEAASQFAEAAVLDETAQQAHHPTARAALDAAAVIARRSAEQAAHRAALLRGVVEGRSAAADDGALVAFILRHRLDNLEFEAGSVDDVSVNRFAAEVSDLLGLSSRSEAVALYKQVERVLLG